ncbi:hypothetical protein GCM10008959_31720 [Deinococcus seoulensis]|uniref:Uncharacterized protein n=1 Tax=Deinococcus seoulensis TaxID=1837379 RepID=A0ABQ2RXX3_9DEIO|nr:hypothetical protein [Deinococcus seoulensis]GGR67199.1 hypothetical protein GCM10008959_31720 [Deinococcus seoulensis]
MPTNYPIRQPTGQYRSLIPRLVSRALSLGTELPVIPGESQPDHSGPVVRFAPLKDRYGAHIGYRVRLQRGDAILHSLDVPDLPKKRVDWMPNNIGTHGSYVGRPNLDALTAAAQQVSIHAEGVMTS